MSRRTWERHRNKARDASVSAAFLDIGEDRLATPTGGARLAEHQKRNSSGASPRKEERGSPSSQTATTMAADRFDSLPLELRLMALGLPMPDNLARAA